MVSTTFWVLAPVLQVVAVKSDGLAESLQLKRSSVLAVDEDTYSLWPLCLMGNTTEANECPPSLR